MGDVWFLEISGVRVEELCEVREQEQVSLVACPPAVRAVRSEPDEAGRTPCSQVHTHCTR